jgi:multisubunit Na+/H+ antiporter MnhC subunit
MVEDRLEILGIAAGVFLVLVGLGTISGTPWTTLSDTGAAVGQVFGALMAIVIGVGLAWLSWSGDGLPS